MSKARGRRFSILSFSSLALAAGIAVYAVVGHAPWLLALAAHLACLSALALAEAWRVRVTGALLLCLGATTTVATATTLLEARDHCATWDRQIAVRIKRTVVWARYYPRQRMTTRPPVRPETATEPVKFGCGTIFDSRATEDELMVSVKIGHASSSEGLDKNFIRRYVRQKLPPIRDCYERHVRRYPRRSDRVLVDFQISPQGAVIASSASGVNEEVSSCVAEVIAGIQFPKPKGTAPVKATYPFLFSPAHRPPDVWMALDD